MVKFILAWAFFALIFSLFLPYPVWLWGGAVAAGIVMIFTS